MSMTKVTPGCVCDLTYPLVSYTNQRAILAIIIQTLTRVYP